MRAEIGTIQKMLLIMISVIKLKIKRFRNKKKFTGTKLYEFFNNSNEKFAFLE
jgi:hypothetical protein